MAAPERFAKRQIRLLHRGRRPYMAHRVMLSRCSSSVAFGAKRTCTARTRSRRAGREAEPVMFDLECPARAVRHGVGQGRQARFNKAGWEGRAGEHDRPGNTDRGDRRPAPAAFLNRQAVAAPPAGGLASGPPGRAGDADTFPPNRSGYPTSCARAHGQHRGLVNHLTRTTSCCPPQS